MIVVLSDGVATDRTRHSEIVETANSGRVKVFTVGLGDSTSYFNNYLYPLANNTGAKFYLASEADELADIYEDINEKIDISVDSDSDGISDYYEENMVIFNGIKLRLDKNNPDSDGDGLLDGEEIVDLKYTYNSDRTKVRVTGKLKSNPTSIDSDGDGLYDNRYRTTSAGVIVAPKDPEPLKAQNGPAGMWDTHVKQQTSGVVCHNYGDGEGLEIEELSTMVSEELQEYIEEKFGVTIPNNKEIADWLVQRLLEARNWANENAESLREAAFMLKKLTNGEKATTIGAYLLNFIQDENGVAYHSQPDTWQRDFGYNDFYDDIFRIGSNMHALSFEFATGSEEYSLWMWKGDYWNLHSGAEIGLYESPENYSGTPHYDVVDFEVPMSLSLYNYYAENNIDNIFNWVPVEEQWWVTGFSGQNPAYMVPNREKMVVIGTVDLSAHVDMYNGLKMAVNNYNEDELIQKYYKYLIFDDNTHKVWVIWYEGVM